MDFAIGSSIANVNYMQNKVFTFFESHCMHRRLGILKECVCYEKSHVQREHNHHIFRWLLRHHISLGSTNEQRERGQYRKKGKKKKMKVGET